MAKKKQKSQISKTHMKTLFKQHKIRGFDINLSRLNLTNDVMYQKALLQYYHIGDCTVRIERLTEGDIHRLSAKKRRLAPKSGTLRSNVSWIPAASSTWKTSTKALSALSEYRNLNAIVTPVVKKDVKRRRAKSMVVELTTNSNENNVDRSNLTMEELHLEFSERYNSPNRGLKPSVDRKLPQPMQKPLSDCQKLINEFQAKLASKKAK